MIRDERHHVGINGWEACPFRTALGLFAANSIREVVSFEELRVLFGCIHSRGELLDKFPAPPLNVSGRLHRLRRRGSMSGFPDWGALVQGSVPDASGNRSPKPPSPRLRRGSEQPAQEVWEGGWGNLFQKVSPSILRTAGRIFPNSNISEITLFVHRGFPSFLSDSSEVSAQEDSFVSLFFASGQSPLTCSPVSGVHFRE